MAQIDEQGEYGECSGVGGKQTLLQTDPIAIEMQSLRYGTTKTGAWQFLSMEINSMQVEENKHGGI